MKKIPSNKYVAAFRKRLKEKGWCVVQSTVPNELKEQLKNYRNQLVEGWEK